MARVFIGVGSNIDPEANVRKALKLLGETVHLLKISEFFRTDPLGNRNQPVFYNGVVEVETELAPADLKFAVLREIEHQLGRERGEDKYAPRPIDLDILIYDNIVISNDEMRLPDPDILQRPFLVALRVHRRPRHALAGQRRAMQT